MGRTGKMVRRSRYWLTGVCGLALLAGCDQPPSEVAAEPVAVSESGTSPLASRQNGMPTAADSAALADVEPPVSPATIAWGSASPGAALQVPDALDVYASTQVAPGMYCIVGALSEDGTDQQPYVALSTVDQGRGPVPGSLQPPLGEYAKARATRCLARDGVLYLLLEFDTDSSPQVSQTMFEVWKLDGVSLSVLHKQPVRLPEQTVAYSLWMPEDDSTFEWKGDALRITGNYFPLSSRDEIKRFEVELDKNLSITPGKE